MDLKFNKQELMNYLLKSWLGKGWVNISKPLQFSIAGKVVELYDNAFAHSDSEIGVFSCGQHYPNKKWLHLTVVDFGVGIPDRVRSLPQNRHLGTLDALKWAFMRGNSTRNLDMGQGMGLYLLQDFLEKNQGALKIFSNDGYVHLKNGRLEFYYQNVDFSGTFIDIAFQCDEAYYCMGSELS